ncbi:hypothetical protein BIFGAL_02997 [Bifidobacterium gallicum DSM 20093 = LMG 11596]|uniref:Uncharacterized protein n=1 Tax=Bifidobacterium gallicum DSM 20093 = LMG 11596 TaxID=561180 RepID=D1NT85_9BIFI|nr:hypothetical protein BIFGAL_02997 [Bifidobacterium gallicum DSM 20093 = LMG 11596]
MRHHTRSWPNFSRASGRILQRIFPQPTQPLPSHDAKAWHNGQV